MSWKKRILVVTSCLFLFAACSDDSKSPSEPEYTLGVLKVLITDAPGDFDAVNVTIAEVSVHFTDGDVMAEDDSTDTEGDTVAEKVSAEDGWVVINDQAQEFDLLTLSDGATDLLGDAELEAGYYSQMRLEISASEIVIDGESYPVKIPSGTLKLVHGFDIVAGETTELVVDFDASRSIHEKGNKGDYQLKPTVRLITKKDTGSIRGVVTNAEHAPVAYAIAGADTINASFIDAIDGGFTLAFLPGGTYTVAISDTLGQSYENSAVESNKGNVTDLGDITLD